MTHYPDENSRSAQLYQRGRQVLAGGTSRLTIVLRPYPIYAREGRGCLLTDVDGVERIDFLNNYTALLHGHAHPAITEAVTRQLAHGASFAQGTEAEIELAEWLVGRVDSFERIRFLNSGTEAVMHAVKAARAHTGRPKIAKCEGVYHGTYEAVETSLDSTPENWGEPEPQAVPFARGTPQGVLDQVVVIPFNDPQGAERILARHAQDLAAVVIDPMPSRAGLIPASPEFLAMVREFTHRHGIVLIFDEVITFRVGPQGAQGELGVSPDLTALGKVIGGGLPVGAVAGRADVMAAFDHQQGKPGVPHGGTFNGNPLTMSAGLAAMKLMTPETFQRLNNLGEMARTALRRAFDVAEVPGQVTGMGSLFRLHLKNVPLSGYRSAYRPPAEADAMVALHRYLLNQGIIIDAGGLGALSTPMGEAEVQQLAEAVQEGLHHLRQQGLLPGKG